MSVSKQMVEKENVMMMEQEVIITDKMVNEDLETDDLDLDFSGLDEVFEFPGSEEDVSAREVDEGLKYERVQHEDTDEEELEEADFAISDLIPSISTVVSRIAEAGVLSVINSNNGKRVSFSSEIYERLKQPTTFQVAYLESQMVIGQHLGDEHPSYYLKKQGAKRVIYNKELVDQITKHCGLDFTNRTSITFPTATYQKINGNIVAVIGME